jgi:hypothetical protein
MLEARPFGGPQGDNGERDKVGTGPRLGTGRRGIYDCRMSWETGSTGPDAAWHLAAGLSLHLAAGLAPRGARTKVRG